MVRLKREREEEASQPGNDGPSPAATTVAVEEAPEIPRWLDDGFPNPAAMDPWEYMEALTAEQWQAHIWYLYRTEPRVVRAGTAGRNHLDKGSWPISVEDIKEKYGGLGFTLILKRDREKIYTERFAIEAPPKFQTGETPEGAEVAAKDKEEQRSAVLLERLIADVITQRDNAQKEGRTFNPHQAIQNALEIQAKGFESVMQMWAAKNTGGGSDGSLLAMILPELIKKAMNPPAPPDPMEHLTKVFELVDKLRGEAPSLAGERTDWKAEIARGFANNAPQILSGVGKIMADYRAAQELITQRMLASQGLLTRTAGAAPAAPMAMPMHPAAAVPMGTSTMQPQPQPQPAPSIEPAEQEAAAMAAFCKQKVMTMLFKLKATATPEEAQEEGDRAAVVLEELFPAFAEHLADTLKNNPALLADDPILRDATKHPLVTHFTEGFVAYFDEEEVGGAGND